MTLRIERGAELIPGYRLLERLGGGGFGEVWKAEAPGGLWKAIKIVYGDVQTASDDSKRAEQELKALSRVKTVRHPYILSLDRYEVVEGRLIIVMELADRNAWDRFKECREQGRPGIPREELLRYMEETAEALDTMNQQYQLQHLDIKPQNLFLVHSHVKIADFGLVKDLQGRAAVITGGVTPVYAAPETFDGWLSRYSDQYSLAIVYQELLTGQRPFGGGNVHQLILQHVQGVPNLNSLPEEERSAIRRALAKNPDERFPSCSELVRALRLARPSEIVSEQPVAQPTASNVIEPTNGHVVVTEEPPLTAPARGGHRLPSDLRTAAASDQVMTIVAGDQHSELAPALVIGLGGLGLSALEAFRLELVERFGPTATPGHLRLIYIDTEAERAPASGSDTLPRIESVIARLNRASHFLRRREGRAKIDDWFSKPLLYRIQRDQLTGGVRALGRLALFDNYRSIAERLRHELSECTHPGDIDGAGEKTSLPYTRPRVFVVAGLGGGTGSGMFIDIAYAVRKLLGELGHSNPDIAGVFVLPGQGSSGSDKLALANGYAALTELEHFSTPGVRFHALYEADDVTLYDSQPPFNRCFLIPGTGTESADKTSAPLAGQFLLQHVITRLGREADSRRAALLSAPGTDNSCLSVVGLYRLRWPERAVLEQAARQLCRQVVERWMSKDSKKPEMPVREALDARWGELEISPEALILHLHGACEKVLGKAADSVFADLIQPLVERRGPANLPDILAVLRDLHRLVGHPSESTVLAGPGALEETVRLEVEPIIRTWQTKLLQLSGQFLEQPRFRVAGTEEAIRQIVERIEDVLSHYEPLYHDLSVKTTQTNDKLQTLLASMAEVGPGNRRAAPMAAELVEMVRLFPKWRYQSLILRSVIFAYTSLRGYFSDQLREVNFYRIRLAELARLFRSPADVPGPDAQSTWVLPPGCQSLDEAVSYLFPATTPADLTDLDERLQSMIRQQFGSMSYICTAAGNFLRNLQGAMVAEMRSAAAERLQAMRVVEMYLSQFPRDAEAKEDLRRAFAMAAPSAASGTQGIQFALVMVPDGNETGSFASLTENVIGQVALLPAGPSQEIVFYRERLVESAVHIDDLVQAGQAAYHELTATEHFTPHSRIDINWQSGVAR
jgi:hypothetical protein